MTSISDEDNVLDERGRLKPEVLKDWVAKGWFVCTEDKNGVKRYDMTDLGRAEVARRTGGMQ